MQPTRMKLALASSQLSWGGGEQFLWNLGQGLLDRGHSVLWICDPASPLFHRVQSHGLDAFKLSGRTPNPRSLFALRRECAKRQIGLLHSNDSHALTWSSLATLGRFGIKKVGIKHTAFPIRSAARYNWMLDALVCVSHAVKKVCVDRGVAEEKSVVIYGGLEPPNLNRTQERQAACETLDISPTTPLYCAVGSLIPCKGYERLIEAAHHLRWHLSDFCVVICGEGKSRDGLEQLVRKYSLQKHVRLLGFQEKPETWISASDAFVHPSSSEGLSLVTIQAQMIGTPVIATAVGGLQEVLHAPGSRQPLGLILDGNDPARLADLMMQAIQNTAQMKSMVQAAKRCAMERFDLDQMVDQFERFYLSLLNSSFFTASSVQERRLAS